MDDEWRISNYPCRRGSGQYSAAKPLVFRVSAYKLLIEEQAAISFRALAVAAEAYHER